MHFYLWITYFGSYVCRSGYLINRKGSWKHSVLQGRCATLRAGSCMARFYLVDGGSEEGVEPRQTDRQNCACDNDLDQCRPLLALLGAVSPPLQSQATAARRERARVNLRIDPREFHLPQ